MSNDKLTTSVVCTSKLTRSFKRTVALRELDVCIEPGELFGLVGPDGAGKTTALRLMAAVMRPTSGRVSIVGYDSVRQAESIRAHVGYMPQRFSLYADLDVLENLNFYADIFSVSAADRRRRIKQLLAFAHLEQFVNRRAGQLSGGMQKKLALACTLIHGPELLLLDEPTTGVDPVSRREFWDILTELHIAGTTIVVSTPYMDEAERCNRVGLLFKGAIIECGTPDEIKSHVPGQLIELQPEPMDALASARAQAIVSKHPNVLEVQVYGDLLHVFVDNASERMPQIKAELEAGGVHLKRMRAVPPRMEEAFISLIHRQVDMADVKRET